MLNKFFKDHPEAYSAVAKKKMGIEFKNIQKIHSHKIGRSSLPVTQAITRLILRLTWGHEGNWTTEDVHFEDVIAGVYRNEFTKIYVYI